MIDATMDAPVLKNPKNLSFRADLASIAIRNQLAEIQNGIMPLLGIQSQDSVANRHKLAPIAPSLGQPAGAEKKFKVGIVGAGCAGLFTAMIFDHLKKRFELDVEYKILESNKEERVGGRLFSYYFKDSGAHGYYDVGAMRFPEIEIMDRTFQLFKTLGMEKHKDAKTKPLPGSLIQYYLSGTNTRLLYNDKCMPVEDSKAAGAVTAAKFGVTGLPDGIEVKTSKELLDPYLQEWRAKYKQNAENFWRDLMHNGDRYTVRTYLSTQAPPDPEDISKSVGPYDYSTIEWLETFNFGNRWYDQAFSEMVLEDLDFDHDKDWFCVEGGSQETCKRMRDAIEKESKKIHYQKQVTAMKWDDAITVDGAKLLVSVKDAEGQTSKETYDAVFNSAPLGSMQRMDLTGLNLNWGTKQAIRSLGYGASCKVGIKFKHMWWMDDTLKLGIKGGVSKTDLPLRACVYPSYNLNPDIDPPSGPGVLLCSYTWSQEAQRIAALINRDSPKGENELKEVLIYDLARLHAKSTAAEDFDHVYKTIHDAYETHYAHDWFADPHTTGAFAYFGPQQFSRLYPWVVRNNGKHIIIGEAASAHHAWVVGALESAVRGVFQFLVNASRYSEAARKAKEAYQKDDIAKPYGPLPAEYDRLADVKVMEAKSKDAEHPDLKEVVTAPSGAAPAPIGEIALHQVMLENIRLQQGGDQLILEDIKKEQIEPLREATVQV